jgi:hypothetical protein
MVFEGTLDEFIREFPAKPIGQHHLYDVSTAINQRFYRYQPAFEQNILSAPDVTKIIARADFPKLRRCIGDAAVQSALRLSDVAFRASTHTAGFLSLRLYRPLRGIDIAPHPRRPRSARCCRASTRTRIASLLRASLSYSHSVCGT